MGIVLGIVGSYKENGAEWCLGCIDIDVGGYTALFPKKRYVSNRIGSVHFYFLFKINDLPIIEKGKRKGEHKTKEKIKIEDFKCDLKFGGYMMSPLSKHPNGNWYLLKNVGGFFVGKFEKASEAKSFLEKQVQQFQHLRQTKREQKEFQNKIEVPTISHERK